MHKQFKQNEIELHKNHNESIKRLETKYIDIMKEEEKPFNFETWLQVLDTLTYKFTFLCLCVGNIF